MTIIRRLTAGLNLNPICYIIGHQKCGSGKFCNRNFCWHNWKVKPFRGIIDLRKEKPNE